MEVFCTTPGPTLVDLCIAPGEFLPLLLKGYAFIISDLLVFS